MPHSILHDDTCFAYLNIFPAETLKIGSLTVRGLAMAAIEQPTIEFTNNFQSRVKVSFRVKFASAELQGGVPTSWLGRYGGYLPPGLGPLYAYSAQIILKVIRIIPQPFVRGTPPPPLPDPVTLQSTSITVSLPTSGNTTSRSATFNYALGPDDALTFDHLHAEIRLFRRSRFGIDLPSVFTFPTDTTLTNFLVLTLSDLANPQPDGTAIP
jgi:hypothetical protein